MRVDTSGIIGLALECGRWSESVELELEVLDVDLDPFVINRVLRGLSDSEMAVRFYWWAESRPGFDHNHFAIAYIISLLFVDDNFALLSEFLERVRSQGVAFHRSLYRVLLSGYVRAGKFDSFIEIFDEMVSSGCREFGVDYNRFIGVMIKNCCFDLVEKYYSMALEKGFCLTSFTYSRWISALCQSNRIELVQELLADMDKFGCFPDIWACNIYIHSLCYHNRLYDALQMNDNVDEAFELASRMLSLDIKLNVSIYNALISGFWRAGSIDKAYKIVSFMQRNGCEPDVVTYNILLNHYCSIGMTDKAENLIRRMEMSGVNPDRYSYNILLKGLCKAHQLDKAFAFVSDHMEVGGFCDIVSCNILIDAFCKAKKVNSALNLFKEMGYKGIQADAVTYGILINGLFSIGYSNLAEELFDQMLNTNNVPTVNVYNIMLHNLCKVGHFKHAQKLFWQMTQKEVPPDTVTFNTLIYWLGKNSRAIEALDLFKEMRTRGVEPDNLTFKYMISGLLDEGKVTLAYEVWEYMIENGLKVRAFSDGSNVLNWCIAEHRFATHLSLVHAPVAPSEPNHSRHTKVAREKKCVTRIASHLHCGVAAINEFSPSYVCQCQRRWIKNICWFGRCSKAVVEDKWWPYVETTARKPIQLKQESRKKGEYIWAKTNFQKIAIYPIRYTGFDMADILSDFPCKQKPLPCKYPPRHLHPGRLIESKARGAGRRHQKAQMDCSNLIRKPT
uniref:Pentatricopeptide repeat-containing protein n=1 Tax=Leersia perrieri TaxID=77586 RepID=A0A0D9X694_9ORYZ